jgi:hypothetical protein
VALPVWDILAIKSPKIIYVSCGNLRVCQWDGLLEDGTPAQPSDCLVRYRVTHLPSSQTVVRTVAFEDLEAARDRIASWNQSNPTMWRYEQM